MNYEDTNSTNATDDSLYNSYVQTTSTSLVNFIYTGQIVVSVVGTSLNLWVLAAILTSREMRSRLRNKTICNTIAGHFLHGAVLLPLTVFNSLTDLITGCAFLSVVGNLQVIREFVVNWLVITILCAFIAHIQDFNPEMRLTSTTTTLASILIQVLPWVASLIAVPSIIRYYDSSELMFETNCLIPNLDSYQVLVPIDTFVPMALSILLLLTATVLWYKRSFIPDYARRRSSQNELTSRGPEIDNILAYVAAVVVFIICDLLKSVIFMNMNWIIEHMPVYNLYLPAMLISDFRLVLMPLSWLLLPDIRQRMKTWRPWYRPAPGFELALTCRNYDSA